MSDQSKCDLRISEYLSSPSGNSSFPDQYPPWARRTSTSPPFTTPMPFASVVLDNRRELSFGAGAGDGALAVSAFSATAFSPRKPSQRRPSPRNLLGVATFFSAAFSGKLGPAFSAAAFSAAAFSRGSLLRSGHFLRRGLLQPFQPQPSFRWPCPGAAVFLSEAFFSAAAFSASALFSAAILTLHRPFSPQRTSQTQPSSLLPFSPQRPSSLQRPCPWQAWPLPFRLRTFRLAAFLSRGGLLSGVLILGG